MPHATQIKRPECLRETGWRLTESTGTPDLVLAGVTQSFGAYLVLLHRNLRRFRFPRDVQRHMHYQLLVVRYDEIDLGGESARRA